MKTWEQTEKEYREWHSKCLTYPTPEKILAWWKSREPDLKEELSEFIEWYYDKYSCNICTTDIDNYIKSRQ